MEGFESCKSADIRADVVKILEKFEPESEPLRQLLRKLEREEGSGRSQISIAREFADGDELKAQSLLRSVRRYRSNIEAALKERSE